MSIPHGGTLVDRFVATEEEANERARAEFLPRIALRPRDENDLALIANGAFSPLTGFMNRDDYESVLTRMRLAGGFPWTLPVTLSVSRAETPRVGSSVALLDRHGAVCATMKVTDVYEYDKVREAEYVYRTADAGHPGVATLYARDEVHLGGNVSVFERIPDAESFSPRQTRAIFAERGWTTVVGFQTRNPVHRAHEYIQKCALESVDGLLLHPLVGETKNDDIAADVRMRCYRALLEHYYPLDRVVLSTLPAAMRYAGPREAIVHAIVRKNFGCTHFIVGRDHAGVGTYYGTYDAQRIFDEFGSDELGIVPLKYENTFYCRLCEGMASRKTCSHDSSFHVSLSGSAVRTMLKEGRLPPPEFSRPEVAQILVEAAREEVAV